MKLPPMSSSIACFAAPMSPEMPTISRRYAPQISTVRCWPSHFAPFGEFEEHYYSTKAVHFWNRFYKRHKDKFFKDRHYLEKDWGKYFCDSDANDTEAVNGKVVLELGCGTGNTIFPLVAAYPKLFVHACDFSPEAVKLVKLHSDFKADRINVFVCDVAKDDLCHQIKPSSVDVVTLVKLQNRNQIIDENFCFRTDGTCSFYFSEDFLSSLFVRAGFNIADVNIYCRKIENHSKNITMWRRWIRAVFNYI